MRHTRWSTRAFAIALASSLLAGCGDRRKPPARPPTPPPPSVQAPRADFLVAAGDSTFWVSSGPNGVRVRGSPLILARYGGRFYELYVADEDHSYYDAVFTTQRIYRRDLVNGDSAAVFQDSTVPAAARSYAASHPNETPLTPDEDAAEAPATSVTGEVDIVDVHGPYLSYEYRGTNQEKPAPERPGPDAAGSQALRRGVVDLRSGARATLRAMLGRVAGDSALARGRRAFAAARESVRSAHGTERVRLAAAALAEFTFDQLNFSATDVEGDPAVQFFAPGRTRRRGALTLPLPPVRVPEAASIPWWIAERASLPAGGPDSASDVWTRPGLEVVARYDTSGTPEQGQGVVVLLHDLGARSMAATDSTAPHPTPGRPVGPAHEWRVGRFPAPTRRLYWLDRPPLDSAARRALVRAFDESALYGEDARSVRRPLPGARQQPTIAFTALIHRPRSTPGHHVALIPGRRPRGTH